MKNVYVLILSYSFSLIAMDTQEVNKEQTACFEWFDKNPLKAEAFKNLDAENSETLTKRVLYREHPQKVTAAIEQLATNFYNLNKKDTKTLPYTQEFTITSLLEIKKRFQSNQVSEPTDELSTRMWVFKTQLTTEEQSSVTKDNFIKNPQAADDTMQRHSVLLAQELAKRGFIGFEEIDKKSQEIYQNKMDDLKKIYAQNTQDLR